MRPHSPPFFSPALRLHLSGQRRVVAVAALILVAYWSLIMWVSVSSLTAIQSVLARDAARVGEYVVGTLKHRLDLAEAIFDTIDLAYAQIPDPYTVGMIASPAAKSALDQLDAVVLTVEGVEQPLAMAAHGKTLPPCAANTDTTPDTTTASRVTPNTRPPSSTHAHYDVSEAGLFVNYHLTERWNSASSACAKISRQRLQALFAAAIADGPFNVQLTQRTSGVVIASLTSSASGASLPALIHQPIGTYPLSVEVSAHAGADLKRLRERLLPLWTVSLFVSVLIVLGALRVMQYINALECAATRDGLTGLFNRRHFYERAEIELTRHQRDNQPLALILADIDHFKQINDTYGHAIGDEVLRVIAQRLRAASRTTDLVGRYGGEEFILLLSPANLEAATCIAERLRSAIESEPVVTERGPIAVTLSAGLTIHPASEILPLETLAKRADVALYQAKAGGRNRVCVASGETDVHPPG